MSLISSFKIRCGIASFINISVTLYNYIYVLPKCVQLQESGRLVSGVGVPQSQFVQHGNSMASLTQQQQQQQQLVGGTQSFNNVVDMTDLSDDDLIALATNFNFVSSGNSADSRNLADNGFNASIQQQQQQQQLHLNAQTSLRELSLNDQLSLLAAQQRHLQQQQQQQMSAANMHVPDIILTGIYSVTCYLLCLVGSNWLIVSCSQVATETNIVTVD